MKNIAYFILSFLLVSCSKDETIKPVDIMEVTPELRTIQDQAEQLGRLGRDIEGRVQRTLTAAQTAAQIQMAAEQRDVNLELMKLTEIKDGKKLLLAGKYFALLDFQLYQNSEKFEYQSVKRFLKDTVPLFPKELTLKNAMREDKSFNLYALSIAMDAVNPGRTMPAQTLRDAETGIPGSRHVAMARKQRT